MRLFEEIKVRSSADTSEAATRRSEAVGVRARCHGLGASRPAFSFFAWCASCSLLFDQMKAVVRVRMSERPGGFGVTENADRLLRFAASLELPEVERVNVEVLYRAEDQLGKDSNAFPGPGRRYVRSAGRSLFSRPDVLPRRTRISTVSARPLARSRGQRTYAWHTERSGLRRSLRAGARPCLLASGLEAAHTATMATPLRTAAPR